VSKREGSSFSLSTALVAFCGASQSPFKSRWPLQTGSHHHHQIRNPISNNDVFNRQSCRTHHPRLSTSYVVSPLPHTCSTSISPPLPIATAHIRQ